MMQHISGLTVPYQMYYLYSYTLKPLITECWGDQRTDKEMGKIKYQ